MKTAVTTYTSQIDSFLYRFHSGEYQMLNGNGTDFDLNKIINFENGIPGFEDLTKFIVVPLKEHPPFQVFQSLEEPPIGMLVIPVEYFESKQEIKKNGLTRHIHLKKLKKKVLDEEEKQQNILKV